MIKIITTKRFRKLVEDNERMEKELDLFRGQHENLHRLHKAVFDVKNGDISQRDTEIECLTHENNRLRTENGKLRNKIKKLEKQITKGV